MTRPIFEAYLSLLWIELHMCFGNLKSLRRLIQTRKVEPPTARTNTSANKLCLALDLACVFYPKQVLCLQRSAAATMLLRRHGVKAEMVIGVQMLPFKFHAWAEVEGRVINDKPYILEIYQPLERC